MRKIQLGGPRLYIKRDDCTGLALGGNKTRETGVPDRRSAETGATAIISEGGLQSNHVRQTAAAAAESRTECHLVLNRNVPIDNPIYRSSGNLLLDRLLGAATHICAAGETRAARIEALLSELRSRAKSPTTFRPAARPAIGALAMPR